MRVLLALMLLCGFYAGAAAQPLQPGDTIAISVYQDPKLDRQILIPPSGIISFPLAGQLRAGGVTPQALETALRARLKDKFASDLDITVSLVSLRTPEKVEEKLEKPIEEELKPRVYVTGEVLRPGHHVIRTRLNVLQAISMSGGFGIFAAKQRIQIRRRANGAELMYLFDYDAFFSGRNVATNIDLLPGDVVIVPERGPFE